MKHELTDEFDNDQPEHFTHYDYLLQVIVNGQPSAFREHIKKLSNDALVTLLTIVEGQTYKNYVSKEILERMK